MFVDPFQVLGTLEMEKSKNFWQWELMTLVPELNGMELSSVGICPITDWTTTDGIIAILGWKGNFDSKNHLRISY